MPSERHVIKHTRRDGDKLPEPVSWCGEGLNLSDWAFLDAQHLALSLERGTAIAPCDACVESILNTLQAHD